MKKIVTKVRNLQESLKKRTLSNTVWHFLLSRRLTTAESLQNKITVYNMPISAAGTRYFVPRVTDRRCCGEEQRKLVSAQSSSFPEWTIEVIFKMTCTNTRRTAIG